MKLLSFPRVRSLLTIEGLTLVVILGFVAVCSILRNVNLLVVVTGMMLLPLILCWRISRQSVRNLIAERIVSNRTHAGANASIQWKLTNAGPIDLYKPHVVDTIRQLISRNGQIKFSRRRKGLQSRGTVTFDKLPATEDQFASYQIYFAERGIYELGPATVESRYPLGLVRSWFQIAQRQSIHVAPALGELSADWNSKLFNMAQGSSLKTNRRGTMDEEFFAIREWRSGDNKRKIHWRSTAKTGEPMVKQFESTTEQNLALVLDLTAHSDGQAAGSEFNQMAAQCEFILSFAATVLSNWADQPFGQLCIAVASNQAEVLNSNNESEFLAKTMRLLAAAQHGPGNQLPFAIASALDQVSHNVPCIVISTRSSEFSDRMLDPEIANSVSWVQSTDPGFEQVFRRSAKQMKLPPEFAPPSVR